MPRYYLIDHRILFLFGFLFYFIVPLWVGSAHAFPGFPGIELFHGYFQQIPVAAINNYLVITLFWLLAFYAGHFCFKLYKPYKLSLKLFPATRISGMTNLVAIVLFGVLVLFAFLSRNSLFSGYASYDVAARGKMSTLLVVYNFFCVYQLISRQRVSVLLLAGLVVTAILLLSMGGRMYVLQTFIVVLIYKTSFAPRPWRLFKILQIILLGFLVGSLFGLWRMKTTFALENAAYSLLAEPTFTWFSTSSFLSANTQIPYFNIPLNFLTSFLNLIPNTIISLKPYVVSAHQMGYQYINPLGAESMWTSLVINFGSVGSALFLFLTGFLLNFLRHFSERNRFAAVYYIMTCGMIPFQLFRDGFYILNKQLIFNFLVFPGIIFLVLNVMLYMQTSRISHKHPVAGA